MATLDEVLVDVTAEGTKIDSVGVLLAGLKKQAVDAAAGSPATQAKIDAIFKKVEDNKAKIDAAINANTPAAPPGPVVPPGQPAPVKPV